MHETCGYAKNVFLQSIKGGVITDYFHFMDKYYSNNEEFQPVDIIEEPE